MQWKIEIREKEGLFDAVGEGVKKDIGDLGIKGVSHVQFSQVYLIEGAVFEDGIRKICEALLVDPITQDYVIVAVSGRPRVKPGEFTVEVAYNPGVMDPVEDSVLKAIRDLGVPGVTSVKTSRKYVIKGSLSDAQLKTVSEKLLYNKLIQHVVTPQAYVRGGASRT